MRAPFGIGYGDAMKPALCADCGRPMQAAHLDTDVDPPVLYLMCQHGCYYSESRKQWPLRARIRRRLVLGLVRIGRRLWGW